MKLDLIREIVKQSEISLKDLCAQIGMTYQNLNRCIKDNKITANDLEKICFILDVPVCIFFDESKSSNCVIRYKDGVIKKSQIIQESVTKDLELNMYKNEVEHLRKENKLKDRIIELLEAK